MPAKARSESQGRGQTGRRHEILGIFLLAFGIFSGISLIAMHTGRNQMMGPGGAATAAGLYGAFGVASYLLVVAMLAVAWRSFLGRSLVRGMAEGLGALLLLGAVTVLLHLPFAGAGHALRGPGGLMGEWLGEVTASFIGSIGAALAATTLLFATLLLLTDVRVAEVMVVLSWATRQARSALWMGARALGRLVIAMFPEREARSDADDDEAESDAGRAASRAAGARAGRGPRALLPVAEAEVDFDERPRERQRVGRAVAAAVPEPMLQYDSDGVRIGQARAVASAAAGNPRAAMADIRGGGRRVRGAPVDGRPVELRHGRAGRPGRARGRR